MARRTFMMSADAWRWTVLALSFFLCKSNAVLFGTTGRNGKTSNLWEISTAVTSGGQLTGRDLGQIKVDNQGVTISGLAFDRRNRVLGGTMYALISSTSNYLPNYLITLDTETAIGTVVGNTQLDNINGLAISNQGNIYGWHQGSDPNNIVDKLVKLDEDTGIATTLKPSGISTYAYWSEATFGMDFDRISDTTIQFLSAACLYSTINTANGVGIAVGYIRNTFYCGKGSIDPDAMTRQFWSLEVDQSSVTVNVNTQVRIVDLDALETVKVLQTNIDGLETIAFTYDTTNMPSVQPSAVPSRTPTRVPSSQPSAIPSRKPSQHPSQVPSLSPSATPTKLPSIEPSAVPSRMPSRSPSALPSIPPSSTPSRLPSHQPSALPSNLPSKSGAPSRMPSRLPSKTPSATPSRTPPTSPRPTPAPIAPATCSNRPCTTLLFVPGNFVFIIAPIVGCTQVCSPTPELLQLVGWTCGTCP